MIGVPHKATLITLAFQFWMKRGLEGKKGGKKMDTKDLLDEKRRLGVVLSHQVHKYSERDHENTR